MSEKIKGATSGFITVPANSQITVDYSGTFAGCLSSEADLKISFNNGEKSTFGAGIKVYTPDDVAFDKITLFNSNAYDVTIEMTWGFGDIEDSRLNVTSELNIKNTITSPLFVKPSADGRVTGQLDVTDVYSTLRSARAERVNLRVRNIGFSPVYIGHSSAVDDTNGDQVPVGEFWETISSNSFTIVCKSGQSSRISYTEVYHS